ncbi:L-aminoadipate-semialdehyde dehydrogenase-phosphopantetheinyl transferase-like protein [Cricetulus griseus]|uniref:holo-[acyl-carrier-protein] synthase n=1 Tax=Cricetulus griseus TaxID=10029 RepID=A0A061I464_CRIGR|nr:L-aminoadipate-semialdehyde dehydrogenase-phosphopantetheinyl transferase-like protein [Cricetulus griseus]
MIRKLVAEKLNIPWNNIRLQRTSKGKPVLAKDSLNPYPNFNFNISHQGDYAVLAAEPELQVGIDIMKTSFPGSSPRACAIGSHELLTQFYDIRCEIPPVEQIPYPIKKVVDYHH